MLLGLLALVALVPYFACVAVGWICIGIYKGGEWLVRFILDYRRAVRVARLQAELEAKQDKLSATMLQLAGALGANAHQARLALIRESYLAAERTTNRATGS